MNKRKITAILMVICGLIEIPFSWLFINAGSLDREFPNAGIGTFMAVILNLIMVVLGLLILLAKKDKTLLVLRIAMILLLVALVVEIWLSALYAMFTSVPLLILTLVYIFFTGK